MLIEVPVIGVVRHRIVTDGDGVTTLVAFHGCPLHCHFCLNPQSLELREHYPLYTPQTLYDEVFVDNIYFLATGGGVTFGGGEPCVRSQFIKEFRSICGHAWRLRVETSLNVSAEHIERLVPIVDDWIVDIKDMNPEIYHRYTGKTNDQVIGNLKILASHDLQHHVTVRIPLIPGYNTTRDCAHSIDQLRTLGFTQFDQFTYNTVVGKKKQADN